MQAQVTKQRWTSQSCVHQASLTTGAFEVSQYHASPHRMRIQDIDVHNSQRPKIGGNLASKGWEGAHVIAEVQAAECAQSILHTRTNRRRGAQYEGTG